MTNIQKYDILLKRIAIGLKAAASNLFCGFAVFWAESAIAISERCRSTAEWMMK